MDASFRQNTADDPLEARPTTSVFGNERGLSFCDTIDELKARLDAETTSLRAENAGLRSRLDMVEAYTDDFILVRQSLLEEWRTGDKSHRSRAIEMRSLMEGIYALTLKSSNGTNRRKIRQRLYGFLASRKYMA